MMPSSMSMSSNWSISNPWIVYSDPFTFENKSFPWDSNL